MYRKLLTGLLLATSLSASTAIAEEPQAQSFLVSLGSPLKPGDDALRQVMEINEVAAFPHGNRVLVLIETRNLQQLRDYLWARSRTALRIERLTEVSDLRLSSGCQS